MKHDAVQCIKLFFSVNHRNLLHQGLTNIFCPKENISVFHVVNKNKVYFSLQIYFKSSKWCFPYLTSYIGFIWILENCIQKIWSDQNRTLVLV